MKCHHPDVFCTALLNSQPMGFYSVAQIVQDARNHGVDVRPVCVNRSRWDCTLEEIGKSGRFAVRLGMRVVKGLAINDAARIVLARADQPFESADDLWCRSAVPTASLVKLAEADAFLPSLKLERRQAFWVMKALRDEPLELWAAAAEREAKLEAEVKEPKVALKSMTEGREVVEDYSHTGVTLRAHPISFLTLEDETGIVNAVVWSSLFEKQRRIVMSASMMGIHGKIQREGEVVHLVAQRLFDFSRHLATLGELGEEFPLPHGRGDGAKHGGDPDPRDSAKPLVPTRDIYIPDLHIDTLKVKSRNFH